MGYYQQYQTDLYRRGLRGAMKVGAFVEQQGQVPTTEAKSLLQFSRSGEEDAARDDSAMGIYAQETAEKMKNSPVSSRKIRSAHLEMIRIPLRV